MSLYNKHLLIPDTQVRPDVPTDHLEAIGNYIVDHKPDVIVHIGDHYDLPSLSGYEKRGSKYFEGKRYKDDIWAGWESMAVLMGPINRLNSRLKRRKQAPYRPRMVFTLGNHEYRIVRAINDDPRLDGTLGLHHLKLDSFGWEVHDFLDIVTIDGIRYSHYHCNPNSLMGTPVSGSMDTILKNIGYSFTMGHQQTLKYGVQYLGDGTVRQGLIAGAFYQHDEEYKNPQGNKHWRGCVIKHEVREGRYDPCFLSMEYLLKEWL